MVKAASKNKKETKKEVLVLLDAHAILHRAYHALPDFTSQKGEPTGALYGLVAMLMKVIPELKPDYIIACYDLPEPTFRHEVYEEYKSGRAKADDALVAQLDRSRDVFKAFNIPIYEKAGYEADDMLGTIVEQVKKKKNLTTIIASGDMDTLQLVDGDKVTVYTLRKGIQDTVLYNEDAVVERFGFPPKLLPDFKGLRGDPSDNIIGIPGIGEKTGATLIQEFGSIENIYKLLKKDTAAFEKVGIKPRIVALLQENEEEAFFSKMLAEIKRDAPITFTLPKKQWQEGLDTKKVLTLFDELSFRTLRERFMSLFGGGESGKAQSTRGEGDTEAKTSEVIDPKELEETAVMLWLLRSDITNPSLDDMLSYAHTDSFTQARKKIQTQLQKEGLEDMYKTIELPLIPITNEMKKRGIKIDVKYLKELSKEYHKELSKIERRIYKHAGGEFNINSPKQLGEVLFDKLGLSVKNQKKTSTGQKSTKESELEKMKELHPIINDILSYRELQKLLSTYIDNIPQMVEEDGRLHAEFLQTGTTTGRMASQHPNLQNIPIRTESGRRIRNAFIAEEGFQLVACDYSQIDLRVAAFISGDEKLTQIFKSGGDVHTEVAAEVFNLPADKVDSELRRRAKVINFGIIYGMGVNALRAELGKETTSRAEAQQFYNEYFKKFSTLAHYLDRVKAHAHRTGHTETYFGRKRYFEGIRSSVPFIRAAAERMAINAPIQGTTADIIKLATVNIHTYLEKNNLLDDVRLLLQVHDELVYEVKKSKVKSVVPEMKHSMESVISKKESRGIPFLVEASVGNSWGEMKKLT